MIKLIHIVTATGNKELYLNPDCIAMIEPLGKTINLYLQDSFPLPEYLENPLEVQMDVATLAQALSGVYIPRREEPSEF